MRWLQVLVVVQSLLLVGQCFVIWKWRRAVDDALAAVAQAHAAGVAANNVAALAGDQRDRALALLQECLARQTVRH